MRVGGRYRDQRLLDRASSIVQAASPAHRPQSIARTSQARDQLGLIAIGQVQRLARPGELSGEPVGVFEAEISGRESGGDGSVSLRDDVEDLSAIGFTTGDGAGLEVECCVARARFTGAAGVSEEEVETLARELGHTAT